MRSSKSIRRTAPAVASTEDYIPGLAPLEGGTETPGHHLASPSSGWWVKQSAEQTINAAGQPIGYRHQLIHGRKVITSGVGADFGRTFSRQADFLNAQSTRALHQAITTRPRSGHPGQQSPQLINQLTPDIVIPMSTSPTLMPLDRCEYVAHVPLYSEFLLNHLSFARARGLPLYAVDDAASRSSSREAKFVFHLFPSRSVTVQVVKEPGQHLAQLTVTATPGRVLYGHNGHVLSQDEFHDFGAILVHYLTPLVSEPSSVLDLFPGLRPGGPTRWTYLELHLHIRDVGGMVFQKLRHASHPDLRVLSRCWEGESIELGRKEGNIQFSFYYKARQMRSKGGHLADVSREFDDILRLEVRLRGPAIAKYLGNGENIEEWTTTTCELIRGTFIEKAEVEKRLVRFTCQDLFRALRKLFGELRGVWFSDTVLADRKPLDEMGWFLASEACLSGRSLPELRSLMKIYLGDKWDNTGRIRKAAEAELKRQGLRFEELFADSTFQSQPGVSVPAVECCVKYGPEHIGVPWDITQAYTPVGQGFRPHVTFPLYFDCHHEIATA